MPKSRNWVFTINNYTEQDVEELRSIRDTQSIRYIGFQPERGANGTKHLQGLIIFDNPRSLGGVRAINPRGHFETMRGSAAQAKAYCEKEETRDLDAGFGYFESGTLPMGANEQGFRSDLADVAVAIRNGARDRQIFEQFGESFIKYHRGIAAAVSLYQQPRQEPTRVYWYYGPTGTGKTRAAHSEAPSAYWKSCADQWWDGYHGQEDVILDDYRCDFCKFSHLLRLFDRYPLRLNVKGATVEFVAKRIFVTAPQKPQDMWAHRTEEDLGQLMRRITEVKNFPFVVVNQN